MRPPTGSTRRRALVALLASPLAVLVGLWLPGAGQGAPRVDTDLYAAIGLYAFDQGVWWRPTAGAEPYFNKPPLALWIHGGLLNLAGPSVGTPPIWLIRLPTLLAAAGALALTIDLTRRLAGIRTALLTGLVLATTVEFFRYTKAISLDVWLSLWFCGMLWCAARVLTDARPSAVRWLAVGGAPLGLALMTKPLLGLLPWLLIGGWLVWASARVRARRLAWHAGALVIGLAIAAPWHLAMWGHYGGGFWASYVGEQAVDRIATDAMGAKPVWYYPEALLRFYWPWLLTLLAGGVWWAKRGRLAGAPAAGRLVLIWCLGWTVALSLSTDKSSRYFVGVLPVLSIVSGAFLAHGVPGVLRRGAAGAALWGGPVVAGVGAVLLLADVRIHRPPSDHWVELLDVLRDHPGRPVATTHGGPQLGATVYLDRRDWPMVLRDAAPPPPGALVIEPAKRASPGGPVVLRNHRFVVWSAGAPPEGLTTGPSGHPARPGPR